MKDMEKLSHEQLIMHVEGIAADIEQAANIGEIAEYFEDALDVKITIDGNLRYCGVEIAVTLGGPNIYVNTNEGEVQGYWTGDEYYKTLSRHALNEIDSYFEDYYNCCR